MTISVASHENGTLLGPGSVVQIHSDLIGPIPNDDFVYVYLRLDSTGYAVCGAITPMLGRHDFQSILGLFEFGSPFYPQTNAPDGTSVHVHVDAYHANGTLWDSGDSGSYTLSSSALWYLLARAQSGQTGSIAEVLAAVKRTFPAP